MTATSAEKSITNIRQKIRSNTLLYIGIFGKIVTSFLDILTNILMKIFN